MARLHRRRRDRRPAGNAVALLGVQHRLAGHSNSLDDLGLAFVIVSLVVLAGTLVAQPLLARRFSQPEGVEAPSPSTEPL